MRGKYHCIDIWKNNANCNNNNVSKCRQHHRAGAALANLGNSNSKQWISRRIKRFPVNNINKKVVDKTYI